MDATKVEKIVTLIKEFIDHANITIWEEESYITLITYSGRNMFGQFCYAIVAPGSEQYQDFVSDLEDYANEKEIEIDKKDLRELRKPGRDTLGCSSVFYLPILKKIDGLEP
jgi:hypothetical protein